MDRFEKIKRITQILIAEKEYEKHQAHTEGKSNQIAELYSNLVGLKTVYKHDTWDRGGFRFFSDEMIAKKWNKDIPL